MIKRTLYFGSQAYLSTKDEQLVIAKGDAVDLTVCETGEWVDLLAPREERTPQPPLQRGAMGNRTLQKRASPSENATIPIEDIGVLILDHQQITITHAAIAKLVANNVALITCNETHHPTGMLLPLDGSTEQGERFRHQIEASEPLRKQLWAQTVSAKILNQAAALGKIGVPVDNMRKWARDVTSGDPKNFEARAAVYYWANLFEKHSPSSPAHLREREKGVFIRDRDGAPPNNLLNYGYAILRAVVARALVSSGLLPTLGIHHRNKYNAYCLADDVMEPYRPFVDMLALHIIKMEPDIETLSPAIKRQLLGIPTLDVKIEGSMRPLMVAVTHTTASVAKCFLGERRKILYPELP